MQCRDASNCYTYGRVMTLSRIFYAIRISVGFLDRTGLYQKVRFSCNIQVQTLVNCRCSAKGDLPKDVSRCICYVQILAGGCVLRVGATTINLRSYSNYRNGLYLHRSRLKKFADGIFYRAHHTTGFAVGLARFEASRHRLSRPSFEMN